ncbi:hypothetical protein OAA60_03000 [Porticoccaceae bacterium]|nr:hypothetical protein [Porticoccaceae bacterium]
MDTPTTEQPAEVQPETNYGALAKASYGNNFHGEVSEPTPEPVVEAEEAAPEQVAEEAVEEVAQEAAEVEESTEEAPVEAAESDVVDSWEELVESQAWEPDWANNLKHTVKVDGEESQVTTAELKADWQIRQATEKRFNESKEKGKALNQAIAQKSQELNERFAVAAKIIEDAENALLGDEAAIDPNLRTNDPAEWAAKEREIDKRRQNLAKLKTDAQSEYQKVAQHTKAERDKQLAEMIQGEQEKLSTAIPEWSNQDVASAEKAKLAKYLNSVGYSEQELNQAYDSRMIVMARKAMLHDERDTKIEPQKKRLKTIPKTLKSGAQKSETQTQLEQRDKLKAKLKASGKLEDAMALFRLGN